MNNFEKLLDNIFKLVEKKAVEYEPKANNFIKKLNQRIENELDKKHKKTSLI